MICLNCGSVMNISTVMEILKEKHNTGHCRKGSKLFVPSRMSVIRHTNDLDKTSSQNNPEGKDSGFESLDDEEMRDLKPLLKENVSCETDTETSSSSSPIFQPKKNLILSLDKNPDPDVEKLHSHLDPVCLIRYDARSIVKLVTQIDLEEKIPAKHSVSPDLKYLVQLYENTEEGVLKGTLLRLIRNISNDEYNRNNSAICPDKINTKPATRHSVDFCIDNILLPDQIPPKPPKLFLPGYYTNPCLPRCHSFDGEMPPTPNNTSPTEILFSPVDNPFHRAAPLLPSFGQAFPSETVIKLNSDSKLPIQCEYCHKQFSHEGAWQRHLLTHKGKRTHKCSRCSRSFYDQSSYLRHLKSHNGEKAHKCKNCSMAFSKRSALEVHMRTHTGERPFKCKFCGKGFSISGNLHRHILIHTGHRPYKCGKCPRAFNNPSHLARHISSFHT